MAVDRVPAGVADAIGEPAAVNAGLGIEHRLRPLDPVDFGRGLAPKALRVALPARIDLVIAARLGVHRFLGARLSSDARLLQAAPHALVLTLPWRRRGGVNLR